ncbi:hypothetical protein RJ639_032646 [Escallonia herrerae]|uniref:Uncharacterized protein n=1 Tax=Escallonia herrerae TaxID=1293975 RepID=A0AA89BJV2_9ASTE|nr:hypothetical protein RJ639_032646 [Escallonia herrerae]
MALLFFKPCVPAFRLPATKLKSLPTMAALNNFATAHHHPRRKLPILLFDVMDTIVRDPFYQDVPAFFGWSWLENFSKMEGLKNCMRRGYSYLDGVEELLQALHRHGYEIHAFTNYPIWYEMIEDKLKLSTYLSWTFCSCKNGKRKPEPDFYLEVLKHLGVDSASCIFIDDRMKNVEAAINAGMAGLQFKNADLLRQDLSLLGVDVSFYKQTK